MSHNDLGALAAPELQPPHLRDQIDSCQIMPGWYYLFQAGKRVGIAGREKGSKPGDPEAEWWYLRTVASDGAAVFEPPGKSGNPVTIEFRVAGPSFPPDWANYAGPSPLIYGHVVYKY